MMLGSLEHTTFERRCQSMSSSDQPRAYIRCYCDEESIAQLLKDLIVTCFGVHEILRNVSVIKAQSQLFSDTRHCPPDAIAVNDNLPFHFLVSCVIN